MKTILFIIFSCVLLFQCSKSKNVNIDLNSIEYKTELDTFEINRYLNEPVDYQKIDELKIRFTQNDLDINTWMQTGNNTEYQYYYENKEIGSMKGYQATIDSTWILGMSGWFMKYFECDSKNLPLRYDLGINSKITEFTDFFGRPTEINAEYLFYNFSDWNSMKNLKIHYRNNYANRIVITTANNVYSSLLHNE